MIDEIAQTLRALLIVIDGRVHQLLKVFQTGFGLVVVLCFQGVLVTSIQNRGFNQIRYRRS